MQIAVAIGSLNNNIQATIAISGTKSNVLSLAGLSLVGMLLPSTFDGTTITFETSDAADGTFVPVIKSDGNPLTYTCAASKFVAVDPKDFYGVLFLKIVAGTAQSTTSTVIKCTARGF